MIVLVETNFIFEIVLQQEQHAACEELLRLYRSGRIRLTIPAFAVAEAGVTLERRTGERRQFLHELTKHTREIGRSQILPAFASVMEELSRQLTTAENDEKLGFFNLRILDLPALDIIPLTSQALLDGLLHQFDGEIAEFPDATIFASVVERLRTARGEGDHSPAWFVSRDRRFRDAKLVDKLRALNCRYIDGFDAAVEAIGRADSQTP